ncbi:MAG: F0F1 ATP synthase subunit A [Anaerolineaceae bacterium]|nr:F0F1 ATP synthase subunit A [Anaerolineaceae bacterium]MDD4043633.1 F0F1 ATP synthase subunit A [Anaerolineaceae bacterium]MDD4577594.1 F0F1 ATP synthase subunit A [Anaerolineaceae bacterium]
MDVIEHPIVFELFGIIPVRDTVVYTWITMGAIIALVLILKLVKPNLLEYILEAIISIIDDAMDVDDLHPYIPLLGSLMVFTLTANLISIVPRMKSPTSDLNTTIALALIVVFSVHIYGMIKKGVWAYLKDFASPIFMFPIELIGQFSRTLSLSMRLFGNILSGDLIVAIVFSIIPVLLPIAMTAVTMISGVLQAFVLTTLAALFISSAVEINEEDSKMKAEGKKTSIKELFNKNFRKEKINGESRS